ncbi:heat shock protein Hsp20 [Desulfurobacterium thermolithotrophum DSM 11699]|uniref:Heat shock protein Hsp20 n=1 Tax=Desulfurobacterium thermolithotrophum (strain DSM 11699 / BSA) TaxID=868864 RepID=F0S317_DESTD|nr:Hsp20/alpha crystallin family protein [Desulfurobacterium thermolithotrophum]ADY73239.1 heat shock protein Hsp20 [Desulfurobacterium thermolithotrophum DSM 11699]
MFGGFFGRRGGYDPFEDIFRQFQEMERFMSEMMRGFGREFPGFEAGFEPRIEMYETPDEVVVKAEMPGLDKDSIDVKVRGNYLIIKGVKKQEKKDEKENVFFSESFYGEFQRVIPLPVEVKEEGIEAIYDKGILEIRLPKADSARKEVKIIVKEPEKDETDKKNEEEK